MLHHQHTNTNTREAPQSDVFFPWKRNCIFTCEKATTTSNPWQQVATSSAGGGTSGGTSFNKVSLRFWPEALPRNHFQNEDRFSLYHCIFVIHLHVYIYIYICILYMYDILQICIYSYRNDPPYRKAPQRPPTSLQYSVASAAPNVPTRFLPRWVLAATVVATVARTASQDTRVLIGEETRPCFWRHWPSKIEV